MSGGADEEYIAPQSRNLNRDANKSRRNREILKGEPQNLRIQRAPTKAKESRSKSNPSRDFGGDSVAASGDHKSGDFHYRQDNSNGNEGIGEHSQDGLERAMGNSRDASRDVDQSDHSPDAGDAGTTLPNGDRSDKNSQDAISLRGNSRSASENEFGRNSEGADTIDETAYRKGDEVESSDNAIATDAAAKSVDRSSSDVGVHTYKTGLSMEDALNAERPDVDVHESKEDGVAVSFVKRSDPLEIPSAGGDSGDQASFDRASSDGNDHNLVSLGSANTHESHKTNASNDAEDSTNGRGRQFETEGSAVKSSTVPAKSIDASEDTEDKTKQSADLEKNSSPLEVPVADGGDELADKSSAKLAKSIESKGTEDNTKQSSDLLGKNSSVLEIPVAVDESEDQLDGKTKGSVDTAATLTNRTVPTSEASKDVQAAELPSGSTKEDDKTGVSSQDPPLARESAPLEVPSKAHDDATEARVDSGSKEIQESVSKQNATSTDDKPLKEVEDEVTTNTDSSELGGINQTSSSEVKEVEDESQSIDSPKSNETIVNGTATFSRSSTEGNETISVQSNYTGSETHAANSNSTYASEDSASKTAEPASKSLAETKQTSANSGDGSRPQVNLTAEDDDPSSTANDTLASASISDNTTATAEGDAVVEEVNSVGSKIDAENDSSQNGQENVTESSRDDTNSTLSDRSNSTEHLEAANLTAPATDEGNSTADIVREGKFLGQDPRQPSNDVENKSSESESAQVAPDLTHGSRSGGSQEKNAEDAKPATKKKGKHSLRGAIGKKEKVAVA